MTEMDHRCGKFKTSTRAEWDAKHTEHGEPVRDDPEAQPPGGYRLIRFRCPCGAAFVDMEARHEV